MKILTEPEKFVPRHYRAQAHGPVTSCENSAGIITAQKAHSLTWRLIGSR